VARQEYACHARAVAAVAPDVPSSRVWIVVAVALIVAETLVVYPLRRVAPEISREWSI
jgi:hypothetical protein